jgi:prepilin-type processing-associated H-X9-DG protein
MSLSINGLPDLDPNSWINPSFRKLTEVRNPDPSQLFVFLDVHEDEIYDATFGMPSTGTWGDWRVWWDVPANRHSQGANLSFGDGHVEHWKWRVPKVYKGFLPQSVPSEEFPDYSRLRDGYRQSWN